MAGVFTIACASLITEERCFMLSQESRPRNHTEQRGLTYDRNVVHPGIAAYDTD